jgi:hypothetical protein
MGKICSKCKKFKDYSEFSECKANKDGLSMKCKDCVKLYNAQYHLNNKEVINKKHRQYYLNNKEKFAKRWKSYYTKNRRQRIKDCKTYRLSIAKYITFAARLTIDESPKLAKDNVSLEVKCKYCGRYFKPTVQLVQDRIQALNKEEHLNFGSSFCYCSDNCKEACPTYGQHKYPKGFKKASSREVNPFVRQLCLKRDNWTCQICGATQEDDQLHCHHLEGVAKNPRLGNDVTNCITLCKTCHKEVHKLPGCGYNELKCAKT